MEKVAEDRVYEVLKAASVLLLLGSGAFLSVLVFAIVGSDDPVPQHSSVVLIRVFAASLFCNWVGLYCLNPSTRHENLLFKKFILIISTTSSSFFMVLGCRLCISFTAQHP
ncbi:hypothetical protein MKW98_028681 [Papaver atlanticum]|uniref:Transmembrane protein n=1 Tax=Papaver atlanticum TaxID=357466 RepID=A0AAD4X7F4_9MAGN|nr:hypothetical protein MKW98_028681 [Papaver atlanticum]